MERSQLIVQAILEINRLAKADPGVVRIPTATLFLASVDGFRRRRVLVVKFGYPTGAGQGHVKSLIPGFEGSGFFEDLKVLSAVRLEFGGKLLAVDATVQALTQTEMLAYTAPLQATLLMKVESRLGAIGDDSDPRTRGFCYLCGDRTASVPSLRWHIKKCLEAWHSRQSKKSQELRQKPPQGPRLAVPVASGECAAELLSLMHSPHTPTIRVFRTIAHTEETDGPCIRHVRRTIGRCVEPPCCTNLL